MLRGHACCRRFLRPPTSTQESLKINDNALPLQGKGGSIDRLKTIVDPRKPRGVRHPVVTADALHAQKETARYLVEEKQADYLCLGCAM